MVPNLSTARVWLASWAARLARTHSGPDCFVRIVYTEAAEMQGHPLE